MEKPSISPRKPSVSHKAVSSKKKSEVDTTAAAAAAGATASVEKGTGKAEDAKASQLTELERMNKEVRPFRPWPPPHALRNRLIRRGPQLPDAPLSSFFPHLKGNWLVGCRALAVAPPISRSISCRSSPRASLGPAALAP
jgi:hypothetical protein